MSILERVQMLCEKEGISVGKLELILGFGRGAIYKWDKSSPSSDKLAAVARHFNISLSSLYGETSLEDEFPEGVKVLRRASNELTPEARAKMIRLMKAFLDEE